MAFTNFSHNEGRAQAVPRKQESVMMQLNRDYTLASTLGHILTFKKDTPMAVPAIMVRQCAEIGAERVDGKDAFEESREKPPTSPVDPGQRAEDILAAFDTLIEKNEREDFTAAGQPTVAAVTGVVGYKVDRAEVIRAWDQRAEDELNATHGSA